MSWLGRRRRRVFLEQSVWAFPVLGMALALGMAPLVRQLDDVTRWSLLDFTLDGARAVLGGLVASVMSFVVFVFSVLLVAVQIASANLTPRIISGALSRPPVKVCLGLLLFTFTYGLATLGRIEGRVPQLPVAIAIVASLASIVAFLYLIDFMARMLRPVTVLSSVGSSGQRVIESVYPEQLGGSEPPAATPMPSGPTREVVEPGQGGVVLAFDGTGLVDLAARAGGVVGLVPQVGDFVAKGDAVFRLSGGATALADDVLLERLALGGERTLEQDPAFAFRVIVDIASKALSPAINDPTTAVLAIDQLHHLLRNVGRRRLDEGHMSDRSGQLRLLYRTPDWEDFVGLAVTEIRHFGATSIQVARRLRAMIEDLIRSLPDARRPALETELALLERSAERAFRDPEDLARADAPDSQGLGGHVQKASLRLIPRD